MSVKIYSVSEISNLIKDILESNFYGIWIEGEVSSLRYSSTGHLYFSLVDENTSIGAIIYKNKLSKIKFDIKNGLKVVIFGSLSLYLKGGEYRVVVEHIRLSGRGRRFYDLEQLKKEFQKGGYFDRKRKIPPYPKNIVVITSPTGAAIYDIINVLERRGFGLGVYIYPVSVQGDGAKQSILKAFEDINNIEEDMDLVVLARGGGSNEDLWIFNDPDIAKCLYGLKFPTISAIGHEIDFTLCDFVADLRAETPSAAAELLIKSKTEMAENLKKMVFTLNSNIRHIVSTDIRKLMLYSQERMKRRVQSFFSNKILYLDNVEGRLSAGISSILNRNSSILNVKINFLSTKNPDVRLKAMKEKTYLLNYKLEQSIYSIIETKKRVIDFNVYKLNSLNPDNVLKKGYTITTNKAGTVIKSADAALKEDVLETHFYDGKVKSNVIKK